MFEYLIDLALDGAPKDGPLFKPWSNVRRDLANACKKAGVPKITPRDLRRSASKWLRAAGADPNHIAVFMGHKDSRMVERVYGRVSPEALGRLLGNFRNGRGPKGQRLKRCGGASERLAPERLAAKRPSRSERRSTEQLPDTGSQVLDFAKVPGH